MYTNMSTGDFITNDSFFWLYNGVLDAILAINTAITLLALCLMLFYSPQTMMLYRWYLVNITLSCYALDFWMSTVYRPYAIVIPPSISGCATGLLGGHGMKSSYSNWVVFIWLMGVCGMSITWGFLYRLCSVYNRAHYMRRPWVIASMAIMQALYSTPICVYVVLTWPGEEAILAFVKKTSPLVYDTFEQHTCSLMSLDIPWTFMWLSIGTILLVCCISWVFIYFIFHHLRKMRGHMTAKTYNLQKQLAISLSLQSIIPIAMIFVAWLAMAYAVSVQSKHIPRVFMFTISCSVSHTTANGIVIIFVTKPYRRALFSGFRHMVRKLNTAHPTTNIVTVG